MHSGIETVLYSDSMVGDSFNSEDCFTLSPVLCIFRISYSTVQCVSFQLPCLSKKIPTKQQKTNKQYSIKHKNKKSRCLNCNIYGNFAFEILTILTAIPYCYQCRDVPACQKCYLKAILTVLVLTVSQ